uniref:Membrane cofactor protein n=1 Tax=Cacopsylla melanoneura TaxID=428564 RepID=A0A8D8WZ04_9HEMI
MLPYPSGIYRVVTMTVRDMMDPRDGSGVIPIVTHQSTLSADIPNGGFTLINGTVSYLSEVMYFCDEGYKIAGRHHLTCDLDERWDGPPPRCQVVRCSDPPSIQNGEILLSSNTTVAGTVVEYACSSRRYKLIGPKQIVCLPNGHYDSKPPTCKEEIRSPAVTPTLVTKPPTFVTSTYSIKPIVTPAPPPPPREKPRPFTSRPVSRPPIITAPVDEPHIVVAGGTGHPHDNEIPDSVHARNDLTGANVPSNILEDDRIRDTYIGGAKLNLGAIIALGVFGGFVFLAAVVTTIVILIRRNRSAKHYRHRPSPDCHTVASYDSSSSESRGGLNRYYRQAWENLHQSTNSKMNSSGAPLRRGKDDMMRDGSELMVSDLATGYSPHHHNRDKKRHHHHHHHQSSADLRHAGHSSRNRY